MLIKELKMLAQTLNAVVQRNPSLFAAITIAVKNLAEFDYASLNKKTFSEIKLYSKSVEDFFDGHRFKSGKGYISITPTEISSNRTNAERLVEIVQELEGMDSNSFRAEVRREKPKSEKSPQRQKIVEVAKGSNKIFVGHGRSNLWSRVQLYLKDDLGLDSFSFETESHASESIVQILEDFLSKSSFAILILTAEDETSDGKFRARQNVIHEAGLFQGKIGFDKVVLLKQDKVEEFSNIAGLQYIGFSGDNIEQAFYDLTRKLKKVGVIK